MIVKELKEMLKNISDDLPVILIETDSRHDAYEAKCFYATDAAILHSDYDYKNNSDIFALASFKNAFNLPGLFSDGIEINKVLYKAGE